MNKENKIVILLNDTDPFMVKVCVNKFKKERGWDSLTTTNYDEALEKINSDKPDIVLTEIILADSSRNGFDLIKEIKSDPSLKNTKVAVFTELSQEEDRRKAEEIGANSYFIKSDMTIKQVIEEIEKMV